MSISPLQPLPHHLNAKVLGMSGCFPANVFTSTHTMRCTCTCVCPSKNDHHQSPASLCIRVCVCVCVWGGGGTDRLRIQAHHVHVHCMCKNPTSLKMLGLQCCSNAWASIRENNYATNIHRHTSATLITFHWLPTSQHR